MRPTGNIVPLFPGDPTSYPTENPFGGDPNEAPSQNQRFCDGVPVVHFGVPGQKFIIFDRGKFREPHSGLTFPKQKKCLPPSFGFPPKSFPLAGNPPFRGTPSALGHERRHCGTFAVPQIMPLAMRPLREEMAHCRRTALLALGTHFVAAELARGAFAPVQVLAGRLQPRKSARRV